MKNKEEKKWKQDNCQPISINLACRGMLVVVCVWYMDRTGVSVVSVIGIYILVRSALKTIRLSMQIIFSLLSILFLVAIILGIIVFIL